MLLLLLLLSLWWCRCCCCWCLFCCRFVNGIVAIAAISCRHCCSCHCFYVFFGCYFSSIHTPFCIARIITDKIKKVSCNNPRAVGQKIFNNQLICWFWKKTLVTLICPLCCGIMLFMVGPFLYAFIGFSSRIYATIHKPFSLDCQCLIQSICPGWCVTQLFSGLL